VIIWIPVEVDDSALARIVKQSRSPKSKPLDSDDHDIPNRARHGQAVSKPKTPRFERVPSHFGYTVREKTA
jgi:hypothetical protein